MAHRVPKRVLNLVPGSTAADWRKHSNGGGYVYKTAHVEPTAFVGITATVYGEARVLGNASIVGNAQVFGQAVIRGDAVIQGDAHVFDLCRIGGSARVCLNSQVFGNAVVVDYVLVTHHAKVYENAFLGDYCIVQDSAQVRGYSNVKESVGIYGDTIIGGVSSLRGDHIMEGGTWHTSPLAIVGTRHPLMHVAPGIVGVGCQRIDLRKWREVYQIRGYNNNYSIQEIEEYSLYLELFEKRDRALFPEMWD